MIVVVSAYLFSCDRTASDANCWTIRALFIVITITSCLYEIAPAFEFPVFQCFIVHVDFSDTCPLNLLLVRSHQQRYQSSQCILIKDATTWPLDQGVGLRVQPWSCDRGHYKNMPTKVSHFKSFYKSAMPILLYSKICGRLEAPNYFVPHLPPDSFIKIGLD